MKSMEGKHLQSCDTYFDWAALEQSSENCMLSVGALKGLILLIAAKRVPCTCLHLLHLHAGAQCAAPLIPLFPPQQPLEGLPSKLPATSLPAEKKKVS
eukprot:771621-Pelagomonas_calceolata.AAC.3